MLAWMDLSAAVAASPGIDGLSTLVFE